MESDKPADKLADKPAPSPVERAFARIRGNPIVATLVVASTIVIGIASFTDAANKLVAPFRKQSPAAARTQLAQLNVPFTAEAFVAGAASGDATVVKLFLVAGMDANSVSDKQGSALGNAALQGRRDVVTLLLEAGARVVVSDDRPSALGSAAAGGHIDLVRRMLDRKPVPDADAMDEAFVMTASRYTFQQTRHHDAMKLLAERGANVQRASTKIFNDVWTRGLGDADAHEITRVLLDLGADVDGVAGLEGTHVTKATPLMGASAQGYGTTVDLLLARGVRLDVRYDRPEPDDRDWTALMLAIRNQRPEVVRMLLAKGADVEQVNSNGDNGLLLAARHGHAATMQAVLAKATKLEARDRDGRTALMLLIERTRWPGDDTIVPFDALTAMLARGARVDPKDKDGTTALMIAAENGSAASVKLLLDHGARAGDRDAKGRRAIEYVDRDSEPKRTAEIVRLLRKSA